MAVLAARGRAAGAHRGERMRRWVGSFLGMGCGYVLAAVAGCAAVGAASPNAHDRAVEAAMTGAFLAGPLGASIGGVAGYLLGVRGRRGG